MSLILYSQPNCKFCTLAKHWLAEQNIIFEELNIRTDKDALALLKAHGCKTVPQLFKTDKHLAVIGGYEGLLDLDQHEIDSLRELSRISDEG